MSHSDRPMTQDVHRLKVKKTIKGVGGGKGKGAGKLKVRKKAPARRTRARNTIKGR